MDIGIGLTNRPPGTPWARLLEWTPTIGPTVDHPDPVDRLAGVAR